MLYRRTAALGLMVAACGGGEKGPEQGPGASTGGAGGLQTGAGGDVGTGGGGAGTSEGGAVGDSGRAPAPLVCRDAGPSVPLGFHVALSGTSDGDGTPGKPWDLATALLGPSTVKPGDTIWLHDGVYKGGFVSKLIGAEGSPIVVRSFPGEWASIDGNGSPDPALQIYKQWSIFRDLEITNSDPVRITSKRPSGIYVEGKSIKLVNLIIHDVGTGVICNSATATAMELAPDLEVYGCVLYDNGWDDIDRGHGHNLYLQNRDGTKRILDNIIFSSFSFGIHAYSDTDNYFAQGYEIAGNVWFNNGVASGGVDTHKDDCMVGHNGTHPVARLFVHDNYGYAHPEGERDLRLGWAAPNEDVKLLANYLVGQTIFQPSWQSIEMTGNTFYGPLTGVSPGQYPTNTYLAARPTGTKAVVRPNAYQPGRATLIVYNWDLADRAEVDVGSVLAPGTRYQVRNAQDYFAAPVASGTYQGGSISLPMAGLGVAQPIGSPTAIDASEMTGKEFNVFVLTSDCAP